MDGSITILIDGNNEGLKRKLSESEKLISGSATLAEYAGKRINEMFKVGESSTESLIKVQTIVRNLAEIAAASGKSAGSGYAAMAKEIGEAFSGIDNVVGRNSETIGNLAEMLAQVKEAAANAVNNDDTETVSRLSVYEEKLKTQMELLRQNAQEAANLSVELLRVSAAGENNGQQGPGLEAGATGKGADAGNAPDVSWIDGTVQGLEMVSGAFGAASGAASLFGIESRGLQLVMGKLQDVMAIANGLQAVSNGLMKASAFQVSVVGGLKQWWAGIMAQAAAAQTAENVATGAGIAAAQTGTVANTGFALSFRAIGLAIKSIPVLGWISMAVAGLTALFSLWKGKADEIERKQEEMRQHQIEVQKEFTDNVVNTAAPQISKLLLLSAQWKMLGKDMSAQEKFIKNNKNAFRDLGIGINTVKDAQNLLVKNTPAVIEAFMSQAYAAAYSARATKLVADEIGENERHRESTMKIKNMKVYKPEVKAGSADSYSYDVPSVNEIDEEATAKARKDAQEKEDKNYRIKMNNIHAAQRYTIQKVLDHSAGYDKLLADAGVAKYVNPVVEPSYNSNSGDNDARLKEMEAARAKRTGDLNKMEVDLAKAKGMTLDEVLRLNEDTSAKELEELKRDIEDRKKFNEEYNRLTWEKKNPGKNKKAYVPDDSLTAEDDKEFKTRKEFIELRKKKADEAAKKAEEDAKRAVQNRINEQMLKTGTFEQKKVALNDSYDYRISQTNIKEEQDALKIEKENKLKELNYGEFANPLNLTDVLANIDSFSLEYVKALREKIKEYLASDKDKLRAEDVKVLNETVDKMDIHISKKSGFDTKGMKSAYDNVRSSKSKLNEARANSEKVLKDENSTKEEKIKTEKELQEAETEHAKALEILNTKYHSSIEKINEYLGVANAVTGALGKLGIKVPEEVKGAMEGIGETMSSLGSIDVTKPVSVITGVLGAIGGIGKTIGSLFNHDGRKQKQIETIQKQIDGLEKSYKKLEKSIEDAYSSDASSMIREQEEMLENQKALINEQIALEESKKNKDSNKIKEWKDELDKIDDQLGDLKDKEIEAICGKDVKSAIDEFAQAYVEAWANGEDRAKAMKDVVRSVIKSAITELVKSKLKDQVGGLMQYISDSFDNGLTPDETVLDRYEKNMNESLKPLEPLLEKYVKGDQSRTAASSGIETASQDSIDKVFGTITTIQGHTYYMNENIRNMAVNTALITGYTAQIEAYSKNLQRLESIELNIALMKQDINTINLQGINIRR